MHSELKTLANDKNLYSKERNCLEMQLSLSIMIFINARNLDIVI